MKLSLASSYALHAVVHMAGREQFGRVVPSHITAQECGVPERFLLKVLKPLVAAQVLRSIKGPNGGYRLARKPNEITMLEIIEAVSGPIRADDPMSTDDPDDPLNRRLHQVCGEAADQLRKQLGKVKISDLAASK